MFANLHITDSIPRKIIFTYIIGKKKHYCIILIGLEKLSKHEWITEPLGKLKYGNVNNYAQDK